MWKLTNLEEEKKNRSITDTTISRIDEIAVRATLIPAIYVDDNDNPIQVLFCESMSGGNDYINNMPRFLTLTSLLQENDDLVINYSKYHIVNSEEIKDMDNIHNIPEGNYLKAAIDILASTNYPHDSKNDILRTLTHIVHARETN